LPDTPIVHVIDDDPDVLRAVAFLLRTAGLAAEVYRSAEAFLEAAPNLRAACIVTDIRMPRMDGLELQRQLRGSGNRTPVIVMTAHGDVRLAVEAMKAGAVDFIEKPFEYDALLGAVTAALASHEGDLEHRRRADVVRERMALLSERERQVLDGLVAGKSNKVIAHDLNLSARTIEGYRASVMAKMRAHTLSALLRMILADLA
jgi:two-component system response regulator FixJ